MKEIETIPKEVKTRRKLLTGIGIFSLLSVWKLGLFPKRNPVISCAPPPEKKETMKVLSQNGQLVEVYVSKIKLIKGKISDQELLDWIKKQ
jgi:hypothetical protein